MVQQYQILVCLLHCLQTSSEEKCLQMSPKNCYLHRRTTLVNLIQNTTTDGTTQAIIGFNKVAFYPTVVDQNGNVRYLEEEELSRQMLQMEQAFDQGSAMPSPLSASYTMDGTESVVSSGIVLDVNGFAALEELFPEEGRGAPPPPQFPFLGSFTVTFSQP